MFNNKVNVTVETRYKNEDHFKVQRVLGSYQKHGTAMGVSMINDEKIEVSVVTTKGRIKALNRELERLNNLGIVAKRTR